MKYPEVFDNSQKFIFSNWTNDDFTCLYGGTPITVPKGEIREFDMATAYHLTKHLTDREMQKAGKDNLLGVDEERKVFEDKALSPISAGSESPALTALKEKIKEEILKTEKESKGKATKEKKEAVVEEKETEFADIK